MTSQPGPTHLPDVASPTPSGGSPLVRLVHAVEGWRAADTLAHVLARVSSPVTGARPLRELLQGRGTGHAVHPPMTDLPIGLWTSTVVLDVIGE